MRVGHTQYGWIERMVNYAMRRIATPKVAVLPEVSLYRSIHNLPMPVFIDCITTEKFAGLILHGSPTEEQLAEAWQDIMSQYSQAVAQKEVKSIISDLKNLAIREERIFVIEMILGILNSRPTAEAYEALYRFGYPLPRKPFSKENLEVVLRIFMGHFRMDRTQYRLLQEQMNSTQGQKGEIQYDWTYFEDAISAICITMKMPVIRLQDLTVGQYCSYLNQFNNYIKTMKKQSK